jgi:hypothetical protein
MIFDGEIIKKEGYVFKVFLVDDPDMEAPWDNADGHGPVSEWTQRDKRPGEWELNRDHGSKRFYDAQEANKIAKRDGWGLNDKALQELRERINRVKKQVPGTQPGYHRVIWELLPEDQWREPTRGEIRAEAVRRDYEFLRGWCTDQWHYVGVCVMCLGKEEDEPNERVHLDYSESKDLWGVEDSEDDYIEEVAHEHIDEFLAELAAEREAEAREATEALYWAQRDTMTGPAYIRVS